MLQSTFDSHFFLGNDTWKAAGTTTTTGRGVSSYSRTQNTPGDSSGISSNKIHFTRQKKKPPTSESKSHNLLTLPSRRNTSRGGHTGRFCTESAAHSINYWFHKLKTFFQIATLILLRFSTRQTPGKNTKKHQAIPLLLACLTHHNDDD